MEEISSRAAPLRVVRRSAVPHLRIDPGWKCVGAGDCCTRPRDVVMTTMEAARIFERVPKTTTIDFHIPQEHFVAIKAQPCPLYDATAKTCTVYDIRPYNCRRFACMRPEPSMEPWRENANGACLNLLERLAQSRIVRRMVKQIQSKAQPWARAHGWRPDAS